jgi:toxin ParE1/3/4
MAAKRWYRLSPLAEQDLADIWVYTFDKWSLEQADSYHAEIVNAFEGLLSGEKVGRIADIRDFYLKYTVGSHMIYYLKTDNGVDIMRILHQRMDAARHLP